MSDRLFFTVITVTDQLNAYRVFETLNARGVRLSVTDLLKNHLFSLLNQGQQGEHELQTLENRWIGIVSRLGAESFPDFLRAHWTSRRSFVRKTDLFQTIRKEVRDRSDALALIRDMESDLDAYLGLTEPDGSDWPPEQKTLARTLRMFRVRQPLPLLLAAHRHLPAKDVSVVLRAVVNLSFRYNVIGNLQTSEQERVYSREALRAAKGEHRSAGDLIRSFRPIHPGGDAFESAFREKSLSTKQSRNQRIARYILAEIERHEDGGRVDFEDPTISLEHICPTYPEDGWESFGDENLEERTSRLGNMILLEKKLNRSLGNAEFHEKRAAFAKSRLPAARRIAESCEDWTPDDVERRQQQMARAATAIWRTSRMDAG